MKNFFLIVTAILVTNVAFASQLRCSKSAQNGLLNGLFIDLDAQNRIQKVSSSTGNYSALELKECIELRSDVIQCSRSYVKPGNNETVTHVATIYLKNPIEKSIAVRDITDGYLSRTDEQLKHCELVE